METQIFRSNGKLLLTAEYVVLDGAKAIALPSKLGQSLTIDVQKETVPEIIWTAYNSDQSLWFHTRFNYKSFTSPFQNPETETLVSIFSEPQVKEKLLTCNQTLKIETHLQFKKEWGLGTSSTLIDTIAQWLNIDPFTLQRNIFHGSGYDIACARENQPIFYQWQNNKPKIQETHLQKEIIPHLYFIYLNRKQNSRSQIQQYKKTTISSQIIQEISEISTNLSQEKSLQNFQTLIQEHNKITQSFLKQPLISDSFPDFPGTIKSLGAWGGDFIVSISDNNPTQYFIEKGYPTIFNYLELFNL